MYQNIEIYQVRIAYNIHSINDAILVNVSRVMQGQHPSIVFLTNTDILSGYSNDINPAPYFL